MFERPDTGERAVLVHMVFTDDDHNEALSEFRELATSAGAEVAAVVSGQRHKPDPRYFVGAGKVEEIAALVAEGRADLVLVNHALSPAQERNLERAVKCRVLDRSGLILDIFAQRARSSDGRLQVELAQLKHLSTRLVRGWTHLERQKGGIGLRGPGETQLETDRRLIAGRIRNLNKRLEKVQSRRQQGRRARKRAEVPTVSLVGYTNAGKSTLFNVLTSGGVYAADQLFATLDPTLRRVALPGGDHVILADTVGFIRHLPHQLVAAFRSTLEETREADLLLHIIDGADPGCRDNIDEVEKVLAEIDALAVPRIEVFNKTDLMDDIAPRVDRDQDGRPLRVWLSAVTGEGMELLPQILEEIFTSRMVRRRLRLPLAAARQRATLYQLGRVLSEQVLEDDFWELEVEMEEAQWQSLSKNNELSAAMIVDGNGKILAGAA